MVKTTNIGRVRVGRLFYNTLCYTNLHCTVLSFSLHCTSLYCFVLNSTALYCIVHYCTVLHYTEQVQLAHCKDGAQDQRNINAILDLVAGGQEQARARRKEEGGQEVARAWRKEVGEVACRERRRRTNVVRGAGQYVYDEDGQRWELGGGRGS